MHTLLPVHFDRNITITYCDGTTEESNSFPGTYGIIQCRFPKINGYDANNNRITNLVGYNGHTLLKRCPNCEQELSPLDYGASGRVTNSRRDQSHCIECRSN